MLDDPTPPLGDLTPAAPASPAPPPTAPDEPRFVPGSALTMLAAGVAFIVTAFRVSLGGRPLLSGNE